MSLLQECVEVCTLRPAFEQWAVQWVGWSIGCGARVKIWVLPLTTWVGCFPHLVPVLT